MKTLVLAILGFTQKKGKWNWENAAFFNTDFSATQGDDADGSIDSGGL